MDHHLLGVFLWHLEIRDGVKQVDMSYLLTSAHKAIQRLHQFTRIKSITPAEVDKEALIALRSLILQFLFVALRLLLLRHDNLFKLWRIGIVS